MINCVPVHRLKVNLITLASCAALADTACAQGVADDIEEVVVWGRAIDLVGAAVSASEGMVGFDDLSTRPLLRVGELVEVIPGMIATQHSGGGKANQYFLRGINLDHGTDFSVHFDGMPVNFRSHAHGQGYLDLNFIIPELVQTIEYHKGTYDAAAGDFSAASAAYFQTYDRLDRGFTKLTWGSENYWRAVGANSWDTAKGTWLAGADLQFSDGPWDNPEDVRRYNGLLKYSTKLAGLPAEFMATYYANDWNATDQIPLRSVQNGDLGRFGFVDPSVGGKTRRFNLIGNLETEATRYNLFFTSYGLNLYSNPTYFLNDPVNGDQFEQEDRRSVFGGRVDHTRDTRWLGRPLTLLAGLDTRYDHVSKLNLFNSGERTRLSAVRQDRVDEWSVGAYAAAEVSWSSRLRTTLGLRADFYDWDVSASRSENSGGGTDVVLNPKFGVAYAINDSWELYANYGGGFHSNDARAAELSVDPVTGNPAESFDAIVDAVGYEGGFRAVLSDRLNFSTAVFYLELDSELIFSGDDGTTVPNERTERIGIETALFWQATERITVDLSAAKTDARFSDAPAGADSVPDAQETIASAGATLVLENGTTTSLRVRYFGEAPLVEDESVSKSSTTLVNLGFTYPIGNFVLGFDVLNLLDAEENDIEFFYESRLRGEVSPVEDRHFHPVESRELRLNVGYEF